MLKLKFKSKKNNKIRKRLYKHIKADLKLIFIAYISDKLNQPTEVLLKSFRECLPILFPKQPLQDYILQIWDEINR